MFGCLYLNNSAWNGSQLVPKNWVKESTKKQILADSKNDYGYLFWIQTVQGPAKNADYFTYRADGAGG